MKVAKDPKFYVDGRFGWGKKSRRYRAHRAARRIVRQALRKE